MYKYKNIKFTSQFDLPLTISKELQMVNQVALLVLVGTAWSFPGALPRGDGEPPFHVEGHFGTDAPPFNIDFPGHLGMFLK